MTITEEPGRLAIVEADRLMASLHYFALTDTQWVLEQIFVRPGQPVGLAVELLKRFTKAATAAQVTVKLLDPYAKSYFVAHPEPDLLAAHQLPVSGTTAVQPIALNIDHTEEE